MLMLLIRLLIEAFFYHPAGITPGHYPTDWDELFANLEQEARNLPTRRVTVRKWPVRIGLPSHSPSASIGLGI